MRIVDSIRPKGARFVVTVRVAGRSDLPAATVTAATFAEAKAARRRLRQHMRDIVRHGAQPMAALERSGGDVVIAQPPRWRLRLAAALATLARWWLRPGRALLRLSARLSGGAA